VRIVIDPDGDGYRFRLVRRTPEGADVLARSVRAYSDERDCYRVAADLADSPGEVMSVVQQPDGHWQWVANGTDGDALVESPAVFRDATSCGRALDDVRREIGAMYVS